MLEKKFMAVVKYQTTQDPFLGTQQRWTSSPFDEEDQRDLIYKNQAVELPK